MRPERRTSSGQALAGLVLLVLGSLLFAQNLDLLNLREYWRYWGALPLLVGLVKLLGGASRGDRVFGVILAFFGGTQLAKALGYWSPAPADIVAFVLIGVGVYFIVRGLFGRPEAEDAPDSNEWVSAIAIMAGFERTNNSTNFRGGDLTTVMGGCKLDLRHAVLRKPAGIDVFVMWGGIELRVPEDWTVELRGTPLMAGFVDKTRPPAIPSEKRLIVRGVALMGGVEIKN